VIGLWKKSMNSTKKHQVISEIRSWCNVITVNANFSQILTKDTKRIVSSLMAIKLAASHLQNKGNTPKTTQDTISNNSRNPKSLCATFVVDNSALHRLKSTKRTVHKNSRTNKRNAPKNNYDPSLK
jgi:hypothetical protein